MTNKNSEKDLSHNHRVSWAKCCGNIAQDIAQGILAFVPNGLGLLYDTVLKTLPLCGEFFSKRAIEQLCKLLSGITLSQSLAADIAHFIFWPLGFILGTILGSVSHQKAPKYSGLIGKWLFNVCKQTVGGALITLSLLWIFSTFLKENFNITLSLNLFLFVGIFGALMGLLAKTVFLIALNALQASNAAAIRKNVQQAKELSSKLKKIAKQKARSRILMQAQDIIQQMNGGNSQQYLEAFFKEKYDVIAITIHKKIDRHFDYLTDRACHGDLKALQRLQELITTITGSEGRKTKIDTMLERIFNVRTIAKIKDDVDTTYDRWQYSFLRSIET